MMGKLDLTKAIFEEQQDNYAGVTHCTLKVLPPSINPDRPPKNYKDAKGRQAGVGQGIHQNIYDTLIQFKYKDDNGTFLKRKVRLWDKQIQGESFNSSCLYAPNLKVPEARLLAAIAAEHSCYG